MARAASDNIEGAFIRVGTIEELKGHRQLDGRMREARRDGVIGRALKRQR